MLWPARRRRYWRMCVIPLGLAKYLIVMATPAGFEPATFSLEDCLILCAQPSREDHRAQLPLQNRHKSQYTNSLREHGRAQISIWVLPGFFPEQVFRAVSQKTDGRGASGLEQPVK